MSETSLTLGYTQIDCPIIIGCNVFVRECECLSIRWTQIRMHDDAHKIIEFIGNLMTSNNIALLDTFLNGTQEFFVFTFVTAQDVSRALLYSAEAQLSDQLT